MVWVYIGDSHASQALVDEAVAILGVDYANIKDLDPGERIIPPGYMNTQDGTATNNDLLQGKIAYSNGAKLTGTIEKINSYPVFKDTYSDFSWEYLTHNSRNVKCLSIDNTYTPGTTGKNYVIKSGEFTSKLSIPQDVLASYLGLEPQNIREGVTILGVTGTYRGSGEDLTELGASVATIQQTLKDILGDPDA